MIILGVLQAPAPVHHEPLFTILVGIAVMVTFAILFAVFIVSLFRDHLKARGVWYAIKCLPLDVLSFPPVLIIVGIVLSQWIVQLTGGQMELLIFIGVFVVLVILVAYHQIHRPE